MSVFLWAGGAQSNFHTSLLAHHPAKLDACSGLVQTLFGLQGDALFCLVAACSQVRLSWKEPIYYLQSNG
jgi:hypothetical protein